MIVHMNYQQYRTARRLVHSCCNYECVCPQSITYSLICKWFRAAVLPLDAGLCAALSPAPSIGQRRCRECRRLFIPPKRNTLYCPACAANRAKRSKREWARKKRAGV